MHCAVGRNDSLLDLRIGNKQRINTYEIKIKVFLLLRCVKLKKKCFIGFIPPLLHDIWTYEQVPDLSTMLL